MEGSKIVAKAHEYLGVPFRHAGRNLHGVDCVGFVLSVAHDLGITDYEPQPYSRQVDPIRLRKQLQNLCQEIPLSGIEPGDIILLKVGGVPQHLGIYTGETLIHAYEVVGSVCESTWGDYWLGKAEAAFRWK